MSIAAPRLIPSTCESSRAVSGTFDRPLPAWFSAHGWHGAVSRLQPGAITSPRLVVEQDGLTASCLETSGALEFVGRSSMTHVTLLSPLGDGSLWMNGRSVRRQELLSVPPGMDVLAIVRGGSRVLVVSLLAELPNVVGALGYLPTGGDVLADVVTGDCSEREKAACAWRYADELGSRAAKEDQEAYEAAYRIIVTARGYIEAHLGRRIRITDICAHAATSLSRLERTFRREMDLSPSKYLLAIRLEAVRRALQSAQSPQTSVAHFAHDCGFNHLGRFAAAYRRHFGELPSETLRARLRAEV
ncbi:MAG: AraC family transcriptional regulator [Woeseiaceae bacterium]|nr:AraC family transcriptional regulator [Woeseiaceae bacterium]